MMESLIDCPTCDEKPTLSKGPMDWSVCCQNLCVIADTEQEVIAAWNARGKTRFQVDISKGAETIRNLFELTLVGPDTGFKPEELAQALAKTWGLA